MSLFFLYRALRLPPILLAGLVAGGLAVGLCTPACEASDAPAAPAAASTAAPAPPSEASASPWSFSGQFTTVGQYHPAFTAPYSGPNSLDPGSDNAVTADLTLFAKVKLWTGGELNIHPEIDQGFGLSNTVGVAGYPSGEAYKVGAATPYFRLQRLYFQQTSGAAASPSGGSGGDDAAAEWTWTLGKLSVVDIFDTNAYAHDPRGDFLNWSIVDAGAFDYAADAWGYTRGGAVQWSHRGWALRAGLFALSDVPNSKRLDLGFGQYEALGEAQAPYQTGAGHGQIKGLAWVNRGRMARYDDALAQAGAGQLPDVSQARRFTSRSGLAVNLEHTFSDELGAFARLSIAQGDKEAYEFTEIDRSLSVGLSASGARWHRGDDRLGVALAINGLSSSARRYFEGGGNGILIGDSQLPHAGPEQIVETYYAAHARAGLTLSADIQWIDHPAYNRDRGPLRVFGVRLHAEF